MSKKKKKRSWWQRDTAGFAGATTPACHTGTVPVFTDPVSGIMFKGGGNIRSLVIRDELIISAVGDPSPVKLRGISDAGLEAYTNPSILLDWNDGMGFEFGDVFWKALLAKIRQEKRDVLCMCAGGHGRTGTMLAIFAALTGAAKGDPVQFVRDHYCTEAVETKSQIEYVERMTGRKVEAEPAKSYTIVKGFGGFGSLSDYYSWMDRDRDVPNFDVGNSKDQGMLPGWSEVPDKNEKGE